MLSENQLADLVASFDDLHEFRVPVRPGHYVTVARTRGSEHLNRRGGTPGGMTGADVLGQHASDAHIRGTRLPALAGMLAHLGRDTLRDKEAGEMTGDELVLGEGLAGLLPPSGMPSGRVQAGTGDADTAPGDRNPAI